jgi:hypothetical protein
MECPVNDIDRIISEIEEQQKLRVALYRLKCKEALKLFERSGDVNSLLTHSSEVIRLWGKIYLQMGRKEWKKEIRKHIRGDALMPKCITTI